VALTGHTWSQDNHQKTYPTQSQIVDRALKGQHHLEKFRDVFFMDAIWGVQEIWRRRLPSIKMSMFQESLIRRGLQEHPDKEDHMPTCVSYPLGYSAVLAAECLEAVDKVSEDVVHNDSFVNGLTLRFKQSLTYSSSVIKTYNLPSACAGV